MKIRSAPARLAASAIAAPRWLAVVATETWADGFAARSAARSRPTNSPYAGMCWIPSCSTSTSIPSTPRSPASATSSPIVRSRASEFVKNASFFAAPNDV